MAACLPRACSLVLSLSCKDGKRVSVHLFFLKVSRLGTSFSPSVFFGKQLDDAGPILPAGEWDVQGLNCCSLGVVGGSRFIRVPFGLVESGTSFSPCVLFGEHLDDAGPIPSPQAKRMFRGSLAILWVCRSEDPSFLTCCSLRRAVG